MSNRFNIPKEEMDRIIDDLIEYRQTLREVLKGKVKERLRELLDPWIEKYNDEKMDDIEKLLDIK